MGLRISGLILGLLSGIVCGHAQQNSNDSLASLLGAQDSGFPMVVQARDFDFPADHGPHPEYRNEWWYFTGNLDTQSGRRFGYELTFFRFSLLPDSALKETGWRSDQVYVAHFAVTDANGKKFHTAERISRNAMGLAGAQASPFEVWLDDWSIASKPDAGAVDIWTLKARGKHIELELEMESLKPPALNGKSGLSQKSAKTGNASYYYSMPRWQSQGALLIDGEKFEVTGLSWLDREWGSSALDSGQQGWDWFALQLSDGTDLMFYQLRRSDGSVDPFSAGTLIDREGNTRHLTKEQVQVFILDYWDSPAGGRYPSRWQLVLTEAGIELDIKPVIANQELFTQVRYWEGAVDVRGSQNGKQLNGRGYVELTGYARGGGP